MTKGQIAYQEDCLLKPAYHDGIIRPVWEKLSDVVKQSWEKNPTPRKYNELKKGN